MQINVSFHGCLKVFHHFIILETIALHLSEEDLRHQNIMESPSGFAYERSSPYPERKMSQRLN